MLEMYKCDPLVDGLWCAYLEQFAPHWGVMDSQHGFDLCV